MVSLRYRWAIFKNNVKDKPIGRLWAPALAVVLFAVLTMLSSLLWIEVQKRFPLLPPGSYQGEFSQALEGKDGERIRMYVESTPDETLLIALLHPGWDPQYSRLSPLDPTSEEKEVLPIIIKGKGGRLQFTGRRGEDGEFHGVVTNLSTGEEGLWKLAALREGQDSLSTNEEERLRHWLKIRVTLQVEKKKQSTLSTLLKEEGEHLQQLQAAVEDGEAIRDDGNSQYEKTRAEFEDLQRKLRLRLKEAKKLEQKVQLAHKVTAKGKLVSLSREAFQRDNRWIDSMTRSEAASLSPDLQSSLERALELQEIRNEIFSEQRMIDEILRASRRTNRMELPGREVPF